VLCGCCEISTMRLTTAAQRDRDERSLGLAPAASPAAAVVADLAPLAAAGRIVPPLVRPPNLPLHAPLRC
jgi:hypothetical protein